MLCNEVQNYISTAKGLPFFYVVGDSDYEAVLNELKQSGISIVHMSDFCLKEDKFPSIDDLVDYFRTSDVDYRANKVAVVGLGEYLALRGDAYAGTELERLKNTTLGNARVILILRGLSAQVSKLIDGDKRILEQQRAFISENTTTDIAIKNVHGELDLSIKKGFKCLLAELEGGSCGTIYVSSVLTFENSLFPVSDIISAYEVIKLFVKDFDLPAEIGTEEQWRQLLKDISANGKNIATVYSKYDIDEGIYDELYHQISGFEYRNWLAFLYLKQNEEQLQNGYLRHVVQETSNYEDLKNNLLIEITKYTHTDPIFMDSYKERKKLLRDFPEADIAIFMKENEIDPEESIYRYTDNTLLEKKAIIKWIASYGMTEAIEYVYPALNAYLKRYIFDTPVFADELTEYFDKYKLQKVTNHVSDEFVELVEEHAMQHTYTKLPTRSNAIKAIPDKDSAYLYWIDALGVEYLSYITALAKKKGLSIHTDVVRCDLPSITSINKSFYDQWTGSKKYKEDRLDNIKHKDKGGYFFTDEESPIHIPAELDVIEDAINMAAMDLAMHNCKSFVIASDHGASRLAVIKKQEVPYETDTKGEHSGRCCKACDDCNVPFAIEENGYVALSDYGRFKGSRSANVEVHGGASLEEVLVPIVTLTLKKAVNVIVKVMHPEDIKPDRHTGIVLSLYISDVDAPDNVKLVIGDKEYQGEKVDETHFSFKVKDIKRSRKEPYTAEIYDASDLIGNISFSVKGKTGSLNEDFDF